MHEDHVIQASLKKKESKIKLTMEDDSTVNLIMREITGAERDTYMTFMANKMEVRDGKSAGMRDYMRIQSQLLCKCLYYADESPPKLVPEQALQTWPASTLNMLYGHAEKMNGFDKEAEAEAKNA